MLVRQEAEALVDLLENSDGAQIHDKTGMEAAAELRELFGMVSYKTEQSRKRKMQKLGKQISLNPSFYCGDFGSVKIIPDIFK